MKISCGSLKMQHHTKHQKFVDLACYTKYIAYSKMHLRSTNLNQIKFIYFALGVSTGFSAGFSGSGICALIILIL